MQTSILASLSDTGGRSLVDAIVQNLAQLRDEGFRRVWMTQMPYEPDLLTVLAVALREVDAVEVGTGVIPIQNQHPMLLAQRALTLNLIGNGRFILGLGMTHQAVTEGMWGIPWDKPVRRLREYLDGLQPLLIPGAPAPDVYIAALGPQLLRLAGRRTAGTVTWMTGPKTLSEHIGPTLREAAAEAGRPGVRVVAALPISVTDEVDTVRAQAAQQFAMYARLPSYRAMLDREGYSGPEDAAIIGDEQTVRQRLDGLRGVDEFVGVVFDASAEGRARTRALMRQLDA
jgi:5,10-methylenetetrahydromethanopterin reductase